MNILTRFLHALCGLAICCSAHAAERIIETRSGNTLTASQLAQALAGNDFILLGEMHDDPLHHQRRGELLTLLRPLAPAVVAEHLEAGKAFTSSGDLQQDLARAGFDLQGWHWPLHQPLFEAIAAADIPLSGGNIPRALARQIVREREHALPADLAPVIGQAPLTASAQDELDADLLRDHCGQLPASLLPGLRLAQSARDAAMYSALRGVAARPAILVAGNGHVRMDYGVPSLIRQLMPDSRYNSVGFIEDTPELEQELPALRELYDYLWVTAPIQREDPCSAFKDR